jgi:hypothetical protein
MGNGRLNTVNYYARQKERLLDHYGHACKCCGESNAAFLTIDHVNNDGTADRLIHRTTATMSAHIIRQGFPDSYQILCYNCNNGKRKTGVCPHVIANVAL